ncbi:MAG: PRD domain-containing protein [Mycoplasmatales bacterium]
MQIIRVINNNVVISKNAQLEEVVLMGKGIGFGAKIGKDVNISQIEKQYVLTDYQNKHAVDELLNQIPYEYILLAEQITNYAKEKLGRQLSDSLIFTLSDHIYFSIYRYHENQFFVHGLLHEIKRIYPDEYKVAKYALELVNEKFNVKLPEDEIGFFSTHIINASSGNNFQSVKEITELVDTVISAVVTEIGEIDENSIEYFRFITHLKFFAERIISKREYVSTSSDNELYEVIRKKYEEAHKIVLKIHEAILKRYKYTISDSEKLYLTIHVERLLKLV